MKSPVEGTNPTSWVNPHERDTTRGTPNFGGESMHQDEPRQVLQPVFCRCCGLQFGFIVAGDLIPEYCPSHSFLSGVFEVESSNLSAIAYRTGVLYARFKTGLWYEYEGVPRGHFVKMLQINEDHGSVGKFFIENIRNNPAYKYKVVFKAERTDVLPQEPPKSVPTEDFTIRSGSGVVNLSEVKKKE